MIHQFRIVSGTVLFVFLIQHQIGLALGLISIEWMNLAKAYTIDPWRTLPGTVLLTGAILVHGSLALWSLYARVSLRLRPVDYLQFATGLSIPFMVAAHYIAGRILREFYGVEGDYRLTLAVFWVFSPYYVVLMPLALITAWVHGCIGIGTFLSLKPWFRPLKSIGFALAVAFPVIAISGFISSGVEIRILADQAGWLQQVVSESGQTAEHASLVSLYQTRFQWSLLFLIGALLTARGVRMYVRNRITGYRIRYAADRVLKPRAGATLLETIRAHGIPHASVCGGRGRCSTCRVKIRQGGDRLEPPTRKEQIVLRRISAAPDVRLACQIFPRADLEVEPLLPPQASAADGFGKSSYLHGQEREVAIVFVDLRGSTALSEQKLPYDFVFILNQFFNEIASALSETGGHYAQFNGDGLMGLYGLESGVAKGSREAIQGALRMLDRVGSLNDRLKGELGIELKIGIGIHSGDAIVGTMGPADHPIISAIGDNVNIAARLEAHTKEFGVPLIVSETAASNAGLPLTAARLEKVAVRGREEGIRVVVVEDPKSLDTLWGTQESGRSEKKGLDPGVVTP